MKNPKTTLGLIIGTRDFFPAEPVRQARDEVLKLFDALGVDIIALDEQATRYGAVETWEESKKCAALLRANRDRIDGLLVMLPVFGPERAIADAIRLSELNVPVLVQAYPDDLDRLDVVFRRDAFCGKFSVCNNLYQYGIPFSLTADHCVSPTHPDFREEFAQFVAVCRVVRGLRRARLGAVGARPAIFNTVRYSEKLLEAAGITVNTIDLSEVFGAAWKLTDADPRVTVRLEGIHGYIDTRRATNDALVRMAKLGVVLDDWVMENELDAISIQCWTSIQQNYGVNACTIMSMMSENLLPAACEVDMAGALAMYALQLASGKPTALVDWNNNYGAVKDKCILFHCGNWAASFFDGNMRMANAEILATVLGADRTIGTVSGTAKTADATVARITTDDRHGKIKTYVAEGQITDDPLDTFGSRAVLEVRDLQKLLRHVCKNGFEHHAGMTAAHVGNALEEAFSTYLQWDVYRHA
jgi:L-fucose isomerase-like protein